MIATGAFILGVLSFIIGMLSFIYVVDCNLGRFFGHIDEWHEECDLEAWGKLYNGRKIYYILFVPVYRRGFYHSTKMDW